MLLKDEKEFYIYINKLDIGTDMGLFILVARLSDLNIDRLITRFNELGIIFWGGIFHSVISNSKLYEDRIIVQVYPILDRPLFVDGFDFEKINTSLLEQKLQSGIKPLVMILVAGIRNNTSEFLFKLFNKLGNSVHYIGGGAGSLSDPGSKSLFSNEGWRNESCLLTFIPLNVDTSVSHGWEEYSKPMIVTKSEGSTIKEFNWMPAYDVYKEILFELTGIELNEDNFYRMSQKYPLGIEKEYSDFIVRAIIDKTSENGLTTSDAVLENSIFYILHGDKKTLLESSKFKADACTRIKKVCHSSLIFNCISRLSILDSSFDEELNNIHKSIIDIDSNIDSEGVVSLGEISHDEKGCLDFHNISIVRAITSRYEEI